MTEKDKQKWPLIELSKVLIERTDIPSVEDIFTVKIKIIAKIKFNTGEIELRSDTDTKTKMILVKPGDLVISGINACKGAIAICSDNNKTDLAATIHYSSYIPDKSKIEIKYLWYLLRSEVFKDLLNKYLPGGIKIELKPKRFLKIPIPLPSLSEQKQIVSKIEKLFGKIEEAKTLSGNINSETDEVIDSVLNKIIENGKKENWDYVTFDKACEINPSKRNTDYKDGMLISFIPMAFVNAEKGQITKYTVKPYIDVKTGGFKWFIDGDVIFAKITPCMENGKSAIAKDLKNGVGYGSTEFHVLRPKENVYPEWIHYLIRRQSFRESAKDTFKGVAGQQRVPEHFFYEQKVLIPPKDKQKKYIQQLDQLQNKLFAIKQEQTENYLELNALMSSILSKEFIR